MESEILAILQEIRSALYWVIGAVVAAVTIALLRFGLAIRSTIREASEKVFETVAEQYFEEGKLTELVEHCNAKLRERTNHYYALWHLGKAYYSLKEYGKARQTFQRR
jgi:cytochrome c-type biogenesis protein CcmH/NrfG